MNTLKTILSGLCLLCSLLLSAQEKNVPAELPYSNKIEVSDQSLESLFQAPENISLELAPGFHISGKIENKSDHGNSVISLLIKLNNTEGSMLSISRYKDPKGSIYYSGRLLKLHEPDGMVLVEKDKRYFFIETQQRYLVTE
ncbi:MAG TPA: hypothetical protein VGZ90_03590 [Puia sp.]|jgi:hypothetical protein|nr:hypothetical protein [Puia sp.]